MSSQKSGSPKIKILDPFIQAQQATSDAIAEIKRILQQYNSFVIGVMLIGFVVLLFSLGTLLVQSWQFNNSLINANNTIRVQEELIRNTVEQQKEAIDLLQKIDKEVVQQKEK